MIEPKFLQLENHDKGWGCEKWICNNNEFCGKILQFNKGKSFSFHFHILKREVFYITKGLIRFEFLNLNNASRFERILKVGEIVEIPRNCPHKITALEDSEIIEFSTHHEESDSYRIEKGDSQK
jgi:mannose-6-phosphate isomerase-like protein (cupin superfamily)